MRRVALDDPVRRREPSLPAITLPGNASHGLNGYRLGCRCHECRDGAALHARRHTRRKRGELAPYRPPAREHGISSYQAGCRCEDCKRAGRDARRKARAKIRATDPRANEMCPMCGNWYVNVGRHWNCEAVA